MWQFSILFICIFSIESVHIEYPVLEIKNGKIAGISQTTSTGKLFYSFKEIPYAKPPVGDLRFTEPISPLNWNEIRDATKNTKICMQRIPPMDHKAPDPRESEDCLYINVFTPKTLHIKDSALLPVYVYFYGGMMLAGDPTEYNFEGFLDEDIVVVTMGFRSSTLGLLATDDGVIPANLWLKDQTLALKWVNQNIEYFGGDSSKVTIGGHSSGAVAASYHVLNTKSKGLFRAAIIQSHSALFPVFSMNATEAAYKFAEMFDRHVYSKSTHELLNLLRTIPADIITRSEYDYKKRPHWLQTHTLNFVPLWNPVIENPKFENAVIVGPMYENYEQGISNHVPLLIGITSEEVLVVNISNRQPYLDANLSSIIGPGVNVKPENRLKMAEEMKSIYTQTKTFKENMTALLQLLSDDIFGMPIIKQAQLHAEFADVYFYQFSYKGPLNGLEKFKTNPFFNVSGIGHAEHCSELPFLYYYRLNCSVIPSVDDLLIRQRLIKLWSNFIKNVNPTPYPDKLFEEITWPKVKQDDFRYLNISTRMSIESNPRKLVEWTEKLEKYFEHPRYVY